uniref:FXYD domain-containing ion transport regulator n=1 Tax=Salarias fasciatus TaxID=181472 RepID=A0A672I921_SALFA
VLISSGTEIDYDKDFYYHTLRVGGLVFAGVIVFLSFFLLAGKELKNCGKSKKVRRPAWLSELRK